MRHDIALNLPVSTRVAIATLGPLVLAGAVLGARSDAIWVEVRSANFVVFSNAGEDRAREVALDFELVRAVAQQAIPGLEKDPRQPVVVFAVHGEDSLRELVPQFWERSGQRPGGVFRRGPHAHHIALRVDLSRGDRYRLVFHEYFHLLTALNLRNVPRWLDEGLSEFWENVVIRDEFVEVGRPARHHLLHLREGLMMPLRELLSTDRNPHESDPGKAGAFHAQSWLLTHYITTGGRSGETQRALSLYLDLLAQQVEPLEAAEHAFGDLDELDTALRTYARSDRLGFFRLDAPREIGDERLAVRELSRAEALAARGTFLVYGQRPEAARPLLAEALDLDPDQPQAHESMGYLHYRQNERDEAEEWFSRAVALESGGYLSHFYSAVLTRSTDADGPARIVAALRRAIELNPAFAPAYARLAGRLGRHDERLEEAATLARRAAQLEPDNGAYWIALGQVLVRLDRFEEARAAGRNGRVAARSQEVRELAEQFLESLAPVEARQPPGGDQ